MKALAVLVVMIALVVMLDAATLPANGIRNISHDFPYPIHGLEHVVALFAMGFLAAGYAGARVWVVPLACVLLFATGLSLGMLNPAALTRETAIAVLFSALICAVMALSGRRPRLPLAVAIFSLLALVHGYAHGIETSSEVHAIRYSREVVGAIAIVLLAGLFAGMAFHRLSKGWRRPVPADSPETPRPSGDGTMYPTPSGERRAEP